MSLRRLVPCVWVALAACAHQAAVAPSAPKASAPSSAWYGDLHALAEEAAAARGLRLTVAFEVRPLDDADFFTSYREFSKSKNQALMTELTATLKAFSFTGKPMLFDPATSGQLKDVQNEQLLAFYHFESHRLYVRATLPKVLATADDETRASILAHEVGHALQDQLGVSSNIPTTFDAALARRAVLEGDASLTATLVLAKRHHITPTRAVERVRISTSMLTDEQLLEIGGLASGLLSATPLVREVFVFPYLRGQRFIADLFQAGGLSLVDAVVKNPPQRSDAILFPQRYLSGRPAKLGPGPLKQRVGALLLRMLFEQCFPTQAKSYVAWLDRHYVDDGFRAEPGQLEWATVWAQAEPGAKKLFERAAAGDVDPDAAPTEVVGSLVSCLGLKRADYETAQQGEVLGLAAKTAEPAAAAKRLAATARAAPTEPADTAQSVRPPQLALAYRAAGPGLTQAGTWSHQRLGLRLALQPGEQERPNPGASLTLLAPDRSLLLALFVDEPPKQKTNDAFFNGVLGGFASGGKGLPAGFSLATKHSWVTLAAPRDGVVETATSFESPHGEVHLRARVLPMCDSQASVNLVALSYSTGGDQTVERWFAAFESDGANPPLCLEP